MNRLLWRKTREFLFMLYANVSWASPCREEDALRKCLWCKATYLSVICLWQMSLRHHLMLLIMRPSDVSFVRSCSYSCESWPGNEGSDSRVLKRKLSDCISFFFMCTCCETQNTPGGRDFIPIHVSTTWPALYLGGEDIVALHSEMDNDPQTRAGFLSSRLSVWCTTIRHQNASQCLAIHWRPPVSSSVNLLKNQSLTRAFQAR